MAEALPRAVEKIVSEFQPEKIILFGSYAYGHPTPDSDVDLLVIWKTKKPRKERHRAISMLLIPVDDFRTWVEYGEQDIALAKSALRRRKPLLNGACFHSQQCGEKYLKALPLSKVVIFPKLHDLVILDRMCNDAGIITGFDQVQLVDLSEHAVTTRYPGAHLTLEDAKEALEIAKSIRKFARAYLGIK